MVNVDWSRLLDFKYWFEGVAGSYSVTPKIVENSFFFWFFISVFSVLFAVGVLLYAVNTFLDSSNPLSSKLPVWAGNFTWMGILGELWFILRQAEVGFLGSRMWLIVGFFWFLFVLYLILRYIIYFFPLEYRYFKKNKKST